MARSFFVRPIAGAAAALVLVLSFTVLAHISLGHDRLVAVVQHALSTGQFNYEQSTHDPFSECSLLTMEFQRPAGAVENSINTYFAHDFRYHPCQVLRYIAFGGPPTDVDIKGLLVAYPNYPFGARHLVGFLASFMNVGKVRALYTALSYGSVLLMLFAAWRNSPSAAVTIAPIIVFLLFSCSLYAYADNIAHAPGYFVGFTALSVFLEMRGWFERFENRLFFAGFLGVVLTFFDMFNGPSPVVAVLLVVFNQLFYFRGGWRASVGQAVALAGTLAAAYVGYTMVRLGLLYVVYGVGWDRYVSAMAYRLSSAEGDLVINYPLLALRMWNARGSLTFGSEALASQVLFLSIAAWIAAVVTFLYRAMRGNLVWSKNLAVVTLAAIGTFGWFIIFPNHSFVHSEFMVRLVAIPCALGFTALIIAAGPLILFSRLAFVRRRFGMHTRPLS